MRSPSSSSQPVPGGIGGGVGSGVVLAWENTIYDPAGGGHLRIEARALPAGPTVVDMMANAAFLLGLTLALAPDADAWMRQAPFQQAHQSFYRAAQLGSAPSWPGHSGPATGCGRSWRPS